MDDFLGIIGCFVSFVAIPLIAFFIKYKTG